MVEAKKPNDIGMKRGRVLTNLSQPGQLDIIGEGLPVLMKSAGDLLAAAQSLNEHHRAAAILEGQAMEEVGKILILVDIVRCPPKLRPSRIGKLMTWFYDHLARLIYVDAQGWKPINFNQLQEYVDDRRRSHYLEGAVGEYIMPNWEILLRESTLYADIVTTEDGKPYWNEPADWAIPYQNLDPLAWRICTALRNMGAFTREGLDIMSSVWSQVDFASDQHWRDSAMLTEKMLKSLQKVGLVTEAAKQEQLGDLYNNWQLPMYRINFKRIIVPLADLKDERDANYRSELGYYDDRD
jgi:hypothetical protein